MCCGVKHLFTIILLLLSLCCCTSEGEKAHMRAGLDSLNQRNRNYETLAVEEVQPYVDFFTHHGTHNDRMLAHYLMGRAYHAHGEAPMALNYYQQAAESIDTSEIQCDYAQLSRVYMQMGVVYYQQDLFRQQIGMVRQATKYSLLAHDTLTAMYIYEQLCGSYESLGKYDSALFVIDSVARWYQQSGFTQDAAIAKGRASSLLASLHRYEEAQQSMSFYEYTSGFFDENGNIASGREIYYYSKGLLFLHANKYDSAEYYFRKEMSTNHDYNNQNSAAKGLSMLYRCLHQPDSCAKYASYAYAMNDSMYAETSTEIVSRMQAIYNYTRYQQTAAEESKKALLANRRLWIVLSIFLLVSTLTCWLYIARRKVIDYLEKVEVELATTKAEQQELQMNAVANRKTIEENEKKIKQLKKTLGRYGNLVYFGSDKAENDLKHSANYQDLKDRNNKDSKLTEDEWDVASNLLDEYFPGCYDFLISRLTINSVQYKICLLLRLHFINKEVAYMMGYTSAYITMLSSDIIKNLFGKTGGTKELAKELAHLY